MKDFDVERAERAAEDRSFRLGGETFVRRATVRPEATEPWEDVSVLAPQAETLAAVDKTILNLIEPGENGEAHKRWVKLRKREDDAVSIGDLLGLVQWLIEEQTGRPTELPANSSDEPDGTGTPSTVGSSSRATPTVSSNSA